MTDDQSKIVDVVIVSYNSSSVITSALSSLPVWANVIVVDNASSDDIANTVAKFPARLISLDRNYGFGTACNRGAENGTAPYILFLNPDAVIEPEALRHLIEQMEAHDDWGAISPKILASDGKEFFRTRSFFEPALGVPNKPEGAGEVYVLSGSVFLMRRSVFEELDGFDEQIFLFMEDDELFHRIRLSGRKLISDRRVSALHLHGQSSSSDFKLERFKAFEAERSRLYVANKYSIPYHVDKEIGKIRFRLLKALLILDLKRIAQNWGRLQILKEK
ncbi:MAG: glycosyltransferase family 2 protein [Rhodospirillaceae bacterium]|nr:glycosyltransferase family 2 protein [Rhodospirillaceae bacterium]